LGLLKNPPKEKSTAGGNRVVLARLSIQEGLAYLDNKERRGALLDSLARAHGVPRAEADDGLNKLIEVLRLFDQVELVQEARADQLHLSLHLKPVKPLKK
jgi:hypothetical protein